MVTDRSIASSVRFAPATSGKRPAVPVAYLIVLLLAAGMALQSCASTEPATMGPSPSEMEQRLLKAFDHWKGVPYRLGGQTTSGVDCSAFIMLVYRDQFNMNLPRTTDQQLNFGQQVSANRLRIGDLVFFQTGRNTRHVGILLRDGRFMHASTSQGVMISHLSETYWNQRFIQARRVM
ncbi:MAG: NlpC/P60 family protein [Rhodothermaceae bacterium]|nr:NlpC/P60 family protein [Rhodothermaceae bacterium]